MTQADAARLCRKIELSQQDADRVRRGEAPYGRIDYVFRKGATVRGEQARQIGSGFWP